MEVMLSFLRGSFLVFIAYTCIYMAHWLLGMILAVNRLSHFEENQEQAGRLLGDGQALRIPVSVIIPAHNEEDCICQTVEALLQEDYPGLEILVVNDGSTDHTESRLLSRFPLEQTEVSEEPQALPTRHVLRRYVCQVGDKRLTLVTKKNGGKGDALNCGFNLSCGIRCVVVDADTRIRPGAIRIMAARFFTDPRTIVCAGAVGGGQRLRHAAFRRLLVRFQKIEYYRTFYVHRILYDRLNANVIVSGAFAMFDRELVIQVGGYRTDTIGEDMELTMRLHAFCLSQKRDYRIAYVPEAQCDTQVPFYYRDYCRQRRRWHIGLTQSLSSHFYMIGKRYYGWVGTLAVLFTVVYELLAPVIELVGGVIMVLAAMAGIYNVHSALQITAAYLVLSLLTQLLLLAALRTYRVEKISVPEMLKLVLTASTEWLIFHPINMGVKLVSFFTYRKYGKTWSHVRRIREVSHL